MLFEIETHSTINWEYHWEPSTAFKFAEAFITTITLQSNFGVLVAQTCEGKS